MEKKVNETTLLNVEGTYRALQPFDTVAELNANTTAIRAEYGSEMTRATYDVLDVLHRYSCKYPGVCFLSKSKIAAKLNISRMTVIRACKALAELGVIVEHATRRKGGDRRQSSNAIVFVKIMEVTPDVTPECDTVNTPQESPKNTKPSNTRDTDAPVENGKSEVVKEIKSASPKADSADKALLDTDRLPDGWYKESAPYAENLDDLYAITGTLYKAKFGTSIRIEDYVDEFAMVLRKAWTAMRQGRVARSKWHGYLYASFKNTAHAIQAHLDDAPILSDIAAMFEPDYCAQ